MPSQQFMAYSRDKTACFGSHGGHADSESTLFPSHFMGPKNKHPMGRPTIPARIELDARPLTQVCMYEYICITQASTHVA